MINNNKFKYLVSIIIIALLIIYVCNNQNFQWRYLSNISGLIVLLLLTLFWGYLAGLQLFILLKNQKIKLKFIDQLFLPMSIALFGFIIPTNGGMLFSVYFFKKKYNLNSVNGISMSIYVFYISLMMTGIFGILYCILYRNKVVIILSMSIFMIIVPFIVNILPKIFARINFNKSGIIEKITDYLNKIIINANLLLKQKLIFLQIVSINILMIAVNIFGWYWLTLMFHLDAPILSVILIVLFMRLSSIIRILPGNFGVNELFAGGIFHFFGLSGSDGIILSVYSTVVSLIFLIIPLGILHIVINKDILKISDLKNIKKIFNSQ